MVAKFIKGHMVLIVGPRDKNERRLFPEIDKYIGQRGVVADIRGGPTEDPYIYLVELRDSSRLLEVPEDWLEPS